MKRICLCLMMLLMMSACTSGQLESHPSPERLTELPEKRDVPNSFFTGSPVVPLSETEITEVTGWYREDAVFYLQEDGEHSSVHTYNLLTGESADFFQRDGWVVNIAPNVDYTLFAVQLVTPEHEAEVVILDAAGEPQMTIEGLGDDYSVFWNPYVQNRMLAVAFLPDWEYAGYLVDVGTNEVKPVELEQPYVQWLSETEVAYLLWDELEPNYQAPLYIANLEDGKKKLWRENVISFMSFPGRLSLMVTVDSVYDLYSKYSFFRERELAQQIEMPILNTYSEQWWIPFYSYDAAGEIFYYARPKYSGDFLSYTDGFELIAYDVGTNAENKLAELESHEPMQIAPDGNYLLLGSRYESVFDIEQEVLVQLFE
ncbi:hypothetical protein M3202_02340 [Alkalihalobacillus oceani]|uniref:YqgU-like 6-bladed beta-propeller domain-containing protein n=1 Tax=Halalkalibacter oceani TaxID=1653776 RepID=A0A9X2DMX4_9BACI|nr:hypothetical protein [Halalkalibacter oceani]MCM3712905.1 hypothetical protein [Halalkalibacter oceani]